jgi:hypothetical protein
MIRRSIPTLMMTVLAVNLQASQPVLLAPERLTEIRMRIASGQEPTTAAFAELKAFAEKSLQRDPQPPPDGNWKVPGFYQNPEGHRAAKENLANDAHAAFALALLYRLRDNPDERLAEKSAAFCLAWTKVKGLSAEGDSSLAFSYHFPPMIYAADLLRGSPSWTPVHEKAFRGYMEHIQREYRREKYRWNVWSWENNWGCWGALLGISAAAYLDDDIWFQEMVARTQHLVEVTIDDKGEIHKEVRRNQGSGTHGIWYSHFTLQPLTLAAEVARQRGVDLYHFTSPSGHSLRQAHERLVPWVESPATFPYLASRNPADLHLIDRYSHWELLQTRWPSAAASKLLAAKRPMTSPHGLPFTTLLYAGLPPEL